MIPGQNPGCLKMFFRLVSGRLNMRALIIPFFAITLLGACSAPPTIVRVPSYDDYRQQVEAMSALIQQADLVLDAEGIDRFRLLKPTPTEQTAFGLDGYLHLMPKASQQGSGLVVLITPKTEMVQGTDKIMDEVILDVRDAAATLGYQRFVVGAHGWGQVAQVYTDGLPSREQVAEKKRSWREIAERVEKETPK